MTTTREAYAALISEKGAAAAEAIQSLVTPHSGDQLDLLSPDVRPVPVELLKVLSDALSDSGWTDSAAAELIKGLDKLIRAGKPVDTQSLANWTRAHRSDAKAVLDCLDLEPPSGFNIVKLLSRAGSQKLVFLARWEVAQREVVIKKFIGTDTEGVLLRREMQPHPLSMNHPNIISTHIFQNGRDERFLVEERLPEVLNDGWRAKGMQEASNLLRDIASALSFLVERGLVHGDVKPDNIGFENGSYILLDFGICRPAASFAHESHATGSLRTRAPELLFPAGKQSHASDVWALGATVFNAAVGRFPLFNEGEVPPRVWDREDRAAFESMLAQRVSDEWATRCGCTEIPEPLRTIVLRCLQRNPSDRPSPSELVRLAEANLTAFLRVHEGQSTFTPAEEVAQLAQFLPPKDVLALMPENQKKELRDLLARFASQAGLDDQLRSEVETLKERIG